MAVTGGAAAILIGAVTAGDAVSSIFRQWDVFLFLLGLMGIAAIVEQSGVVERLAFYAQRHARGRRDLLLVLVSGVAMLVTAMLSNDATILILTPLVVTMCRRLGVPVLPYAFACALLANTASLLLPVANPANILVLHDAPLRLGTFIRTLWPSELLAVAGTVVGLGIVFRSDLRGPVGSVEQPATDRDTAIAAAGIVVIVGAYLIALSEGWPVGPIAVAGAAGLLVAWKARGRLDLRRFTEEIEWTVFPFLAGLLVLVAAADRGGLGEIVQALLHQTANAGVAGAMALGAALAVAANAMNNLPLAVVAGSGARAATDVSATSIGAALIGIDLGPNFTTVGSLATLLWVLLLARRGIGVTSFEYLRRAWLPAALGLLLALAGLALPR